MLMIKQEGLALPVTPIQKPDGHASSVISGEKLKQLYMLMVRLRAHRQCENKRRRNSGTPQFVEACEAAAVVDLRRGDTVAIHPRQQLGLLAHARAATDRSDHHASAPVWNLIEGVGHDRLAIAAGVAFAHRMLIAGNVVIAFAWSDEIARACDSLVFAQKQNLPIIYLEKTRKRVRKSKPTPHDLPTIPLDDGDAVAAYRVAFEAIEKARRGAGPSLIQCIGQESRLIKSVSVNQRADSVGYMEHYLRKQNLWSDDLRV